MFTRYATQSDAGLTKNLISSAWKKRVFNYLFFSLFIFTFSFTPVRAQMLRDEATLRMLKSCMVSIYNMDISDAEKTCDSISGIWPGNPVKHLLKGAMIYWGNYPLLPASPLRQDFEKELKRCIELCNRQGRENNEEYLLINLCARGMLLLFLSDNGISKEVFPWVPSTYWYLRHSFRYADSIPDFCYFTGLYNYYREAYPRAYPVYKSLALLFPKGNIEKGIEDLRTAAARSVFLRAEGLSFLSWIYMTFEADYREANRYSKELYDLYPSNCQFQANYIKNLLLIKKYDEAERMIDSLSGTNANSFYQVQIVALKGIIMEKKYHNYDKAGILYREVLDSVKVYGTFGDEYASYAWFGLSRISASENNKADEDLFRKKALELAVFRKLNFDN
ncbi:MAG: hypothetical protein ABSG89_09775 [Bacteroidales bacterium]|jgi:tetratricopeptide (TPR) repeat protein